MKIDGKFTFYASFCKLHTVRVHGGPSKSVRERRKKPSFISFLSRGQKIYKARSEANSIFIIRTSSQIADPRPIPHDWSVPM